MSARLRESVSGSTAARLLLAARSLTLKVGSPMSGMHAPRRPSEHLRHSATRLAAVFGPSSSTRNRHSAHGHWSPQDSHAPSVRLAMAPLTVGATESD